MSRVLVIRFSNTMTLTLARPFKYSVRQFLHHETLFVRCDFVHLFFVFG
jgi:hypothetical protein